MPALQWDQSGERLYETGVDHGVLYPLDEPELTPAGVAWNGLTTLTETPSGADANAQYADNIKYLNLIAAEIFGGTIEAFTYPEEFAECDGTVIPTPGVTVGQQSRKVFGLCYRSRVGNDVDGTDHGYRSASGVWRPGGSVGEGLRHDQRLAGGDRVLVGHLDHADSGRRP
jgi:hypothetical protein